MDTVKLNISGMSCGHCVARVRSALAAVPGVTVTSVAVGLATLELEGGLGRLPDVLLAVDRVGYHAEAA